MKTFNKRGDQGETSLLFGGRVSKSHPRCEAYGAIDEATSALGLARSLAQKPKVRDTLRAVQQDLLVVASELATEVDCYPQFLARFQPVTTEMTNRLEALITELESQMEMPRSFILPGPPAGAAALDLARSMLRRAERRVANLKDQGWVTNAEIPRYLNRLADLLFVLARYEEAPEE